VRFVPTPEGVEYYRKTYSVEPVGEVIRSNAS